MKLKHKIFIVIQCIIILLLSIFCVYLIILNGESGRTKQCFFDYGEAIFLSGSTALFVSVSLYNLWEKYRKGVSLTIRVFLYPYLQAIIVFLIILAKKLIVMILKQ